MTPLAIEGYLPRHDSHAPNQWNGNGTNTVAAKKKNNDDNNNNDNDKDAFVPAAAKEDTNADSDDDDDPATSHEPPIVLGSLADLMQWVGTLPDEPCIYDNANPPPPPQALETHVQFSVMDPETFQQQQDQERQEHYQKCLGHFDIFGNDDDGDGDDDHDGSTSTAASCDNDDSSANHHHHHHDDETRIDQTSQENHGNPESDDDDDDDDDDEQDHDDDAIFWWATDENDDNENDDNDKDPALSWEQPRAFLVLWKALAQWVTPAAVQYIRSLQQQQEQQQQQNDLRQTPPPPPPPPPSTCVQPQRTDVEASRCAGLMALLKMHTTKCLPQVANTVTPDTILSNEEVRRAERRLADLLWLFDYRRPMPKLDSRLARALTGILLDAVCGVGEGGWQNDSRMVHGGVDEDDNEHCVVPTAARSDGVPEFCASLGMKAEEYRYLTRSAIQNFGTPFD